jgi:hypothetical protein
MKTIYLFFVFTLLVIIARANEFHVESEASEESEDVEVVEEESSERTLDGMGFIGVGFANAMTKKQKVESKSFTHITTQLKEKNALQGFVEAITLYLDGLFSKESRYL